MSDLKKQVEDALETFWTQNSIPVASETGSTIDEMLVPLDSITACEVLIDIEKIVRKELPIGEVVKRGGYLTKDEFISEVTEAVMKYAGTSP